MDSSTEKPSKWVRFGAIMGVLGLGCAGFYVYKFVRWGGPWNFGPPGASPSATSVSDVSAGMSTGFTRPRPAKRVNEKLKATLSDWNHLVAKGDQSLSPPDLREAWYDILVGPSDQANPNTVPAILEGHFSNPHLRIDNGIAYVSGRWILPRTRRVRGVSPGGSFYGAGEAGQPPEADALSVGTCADDDDQVIDGKLVIFTDATRDIVFFAPGANPSTATLVTKNWKTGSASPRDEEPPLAETEYECQTITSGNYYVVQYDIGLKKHKITPYAWNLASGTHPQYAKDVIVLVNAKVVALDYLTVVKRLPVLTQ